jgi:hypothetical protein
MASSPTSPASRIAAQRIERASVRQNMVGAMPVSKKFAAKAGQREAESHAYGGWFDKDLKEFREKSFGALHEAGRLQDTWAPGMTGDAESALYGGWYSVDPNSMAPKEKPGPRPPQASFLSPPFATQDEVPARSKKPPKVEEAEPWQSVAQGRKAPRRQSIAQAEYNGQFLPAPGEEDVHQVTHFIAGSMNVGELESDPVSVHGCKHFAGDRYVEDHFKWGRMSLLESTATDYTHTGKKVLGAEDHFMEGMGISAIESLQPRGVARVGTAAATSDHFEGGSITMGADAGDGFGGGKGQVAGLTDARDHFSDGYQIRASVAGADLMSADGVGIQRVGKDAMYQFQDGRTGDHFQALPLLTAHRSPLTAQRSTLTAHRSPPTLTTNTHHAHHAPRTTHHAPRTAHGAPRTTHHAHHAHYTLLTTSC